MAEDRIDSIADLAKIKAEVTQIEAMLDSIIAKKAEAAGKAASGGKYASQANGYKEAETALTGLNETVKKSTKLTDEYEKAQKKFNDKQQELVKLMSGSNDKLIEQAQKIKAAKAEQDAKIKSDLAEIGSLDQLRAKQRLLITEYNKMSEATRLNSTRGKELTQQLSDIKTKINSGEEAIKNFTGSVGNYEKGFKSVKAELRETKQAMAALILEGKGIDNPQVKVLAKRLDELSDTMVQVKNSAELADRAGMMTGFVKSVGALAAAFEVAQGAVALFGAENEDMQKVMMRVQGSIALANGLEHVSNAIKKESIVVQYAQKVATMAQTGALVAYNFVVGTSTGLMKAFRLALAATGIGLAVIAITELVLHWKDLFGVVDKSTDAYKQHQKTLEAISKTQEEYTTNLAKEKADVQILFESLKSENLEKGKRKQLIEEINSSYGQYLPNLLDEKSTLIDIEKAQTSVNNAIVNNLKAKVKEGQAQAYIAEIVPLEQRNALLQTYLDKIKEITDSRLQTESLASIEEDNISTMGELEKEAMMGKENLAESIKTINSEMSKNTDSIDKNQSKVNDLINEYAKITPIIYNHEASIKTITEATIKLTKAEYENKIWLAQNTGQTDEKRFAELQYLESLILTNFATNEQIKQYQKLSIELKKYIESKKEVTRLDEENEVVNMPSFGDTELANLKKQQDADEEFAARKIEIYKELYSTLKSLGDSYFAKQYMQLQEQSDADSEAKTNELSNANLTQEQKDSINERYSAKEKQRAKEKKKLDHDKAIADKSFSVAGILLNTALAISKVHAQWGFPAGTAIAIGEAAMGAMQLAAALAVPIPAYVKGRIGGKAETALVGEQGFEGWKHNGMITLTPDKPTIMNLGAGDDIIPHDKIMKMLANPYELNGLIEKNNLDTSKLEVVISKKFENLISTVKSKSELNIKGSLNKGIEYEVKNGNSYIVYIDKKLRN